MKYFLRHRILFTIVVCAFVAHSSYAPDVYWQQWLIDASGSGADGVHTGDINQDGLADVVSGWEESGDLMLYLNPGPRNVKETAAWSRIDVSGGIAMEGIEDAAFADLDLDGFDDAIISSTEGDTQHLGIHWLDGDDIASAAAWHGAVLVPAERSGYMKARSAQIDGIAGADIVVGTRDVRGENAGIYWFRAPSGSHPGNTGRWQRFYIGAVDIKTVTLVIKDMDADGIADIVFAGRNGIGWFRNPGAAALTQAPSARSWERIMIAATGSEFAFCDEVADGASDIIVATSHRSGMVAKWLKRLDATGRHWEEYPIVSDTVRNESSGRKFVIKGVACGYVNADDKIDVVFTGSGHGHGVFMMSPRTDIASGLAWDTVNLTPHAAYMKYDNLILLDMDADGDLDILTTEEGQGVFTSGQGVLWLENPLKTLSALNTTH
ncbi:MAG: hypothetical protein Hals2KO_08300 [Halioglobus sp.]